MTEGEVQKAVFEDLKARAMPGVVFWHVPNDKSSRRKAGFRAGVSDVHALHRSKFYVVELKKTGGRATEDQLEFIADVNHAGGFGCVAEGLPEALGILETWGLLRRAA